jgi:hypothetical protein
MNTCELYRDMEDTNSNWNIGEYLAGLWSRDIARGLLWHSEIQAAEHVSKYRSPSWSWAVTNKPIVFDLYDDEAAFERPPGFQVVSYDIELSDESNPYGEVLSGSLTLRGRTKVLVRSRQVIYSWPCYFDHGSIYFDETENPNDGKRQDFEFDEAFQTSGEHGQYLVALRNRRGKDSSWEIDVGSFYPEEYLLLFTQRTTYDYCLVLQRVESRGINTFKRVGVLKSYVRELDQMEKWDVQTVVLI